MPVKISDITERLSLHIHYRIIPRLFATLPPLVLQTLASPLSQTHPSHVGLEEGGWRRGINNSSVNTQATYSHGFCEGSREGITHRHSLLCLARETAGRGLTGLREKTRPENPVSCTTKKTWFRFRPLCPGKRETVKMRVRAQFQGNCTCYLYIEITKKKGNH